MKFLRNRRLLKAIATFFLVSFLNSVIFPAVSYALTAGPTAPEFSSFEPVDTTDMVNLATGDFTYNIPLLEVPGPEGGYPLALSYHAGIQPNEEASWVGLGWTLNPGAVNRTVNGYADDMNAADRWVHDYWDGGETNTFSVGVGYSGVNFGLTVSDDTYKGFGVGMSGGFGVGPFEVDFGTDPYGDPNLSVGLSLGKQVELGKGSNMALGLGTSVGVSTNFESSSTYGKMGITGINSKTNFKHPILGFGISSESSKPSMSVAGISAMDVNNTAGKISTSSSGFNLIIPTPVPTLYFSLGYNYTRYWSDEDQTIQSYGSLYFQNSDGILPGNPYFASDLSLDSYSLNDPDNGPDGMPDKELGGSFPAYDAYNVTGQGLSGSIQPYILENRYLFRQNVYDIDNQENVVHYYRSNQPYSGSKVNFRFKYDFSNSFEMAPGAYPSVGGTSVNVENETRTYDSYGFDPLDNHLAGSKHVEWFSNFEIQNGSAYNKGFITFEEHYAQRAASKYSSFNNVGDQIGGYMITNESGVTYHYSLPIYAYDEYSRTQSNDGLTFRETSNTQPYAYTWLLTGITGPDYVDRGNYGFTEDDYGYWVKFEYGMWTDAYNWRNPATGWHKDIDNDFNFYSRGKKELYYLDAVKTRTYTAIFEKELRNDAKSVAHPDNGGFHSTSALGSCAPGALPSYSGDQSYYNFPISTLRLKNIYLLRNADYQNFLDLNANGQFSQLKSKGTLAPLNFTYSGFITCCNSSTCQTTQNSHTSVVSHLGNNVVDATDLLNTDFINYAQRVISFGHDYYLSPGTPNSYDNSNYVKYPVASPALTGKLTLQSLEFKGRQGQSIIPAMNFNYGECTTPGCTTPNPDNPAYNGDASDLWGMYKSDYNPGLAASNRNLAKAVSDISAENVDAWSLKEIETSLGAKIKINYESDEYKYIKLNTQQLLRINNVINNGNNQFTLEILDPGVDLSGFFAINDFIEVDVLGAHRYSNASNKSYTNCNLYGSGGSVLQAWEYYSFAETHYSSTASKIVSIDNVNKKIVIEDANLLSQLQASIVRSHNITDMTGGSVICDNANDYIGTYTFSSQWPEYIVTGMISTPKLSNRKGGGLRVKEVSVEADSKTYSTVYTYIDGVTSYEPFGILEPVFNANFVNAINNNPAGNGYLNSYKKYFKKVAFGRYQGLIATSREVCAPGVIYSKVAIEEKVMENGVPTTIPGKKEFEFSTYEEGNLRTVERTSSKQGTTYGTVTFKDFTPRIGNLKKVTTYDNSNNKLQEISNVYLHDLSATVTNNQNFIDQLELKFQNQGRIDQLFHEYRQVGSTNAPQFVYSKKEEYPSILVSTQMKNYKTGIVQESENLAFDFYSGNQSKVLTHDGYGNHFVSVSEPAYYQKYPSMGLKVHNVWNKHMLTQNAANYVYKVDDANYNSYIGLVSANIQTWDKLYYDWGQSTGIYVESWVPMKTYYWAGDPEALQEDGTHAYADFQNDPFNWVYNYPVDPNNTFWVKSGEVSFYDEYSHILESMDINNNYSASIMNKDHTLVTAFAMNAKRAEIAYSGAEYYAGNTELEGGVSRGEGEAANAFAHTGKYSLRADPGKTGFTFSLNGNQLDPNRTYRASVWVYMPGLSEQNLQDAELYYKIGTSPDVVSIPKIAHKAGSKCLINLDIIPNGATDIIIGCRNKSAVRSIYFDDFRVQPIDATMTTYVYDPVTNELSAILNNYNLYSRFEYNAAGRLTKKYQEIFHTTEKLVSEQKINYGKNNQ